MGRMIVIAFLLIVILWPVCSWEQSSFYFSCPGPGGSLGSSGPFRTGPMVVEPGKELAEALSSYFLNGQSWLKC